MLVVLSPAKTLDFETPPVVATYTQPAFLEQSQLLIERLRTLSPAEIASLMGISDRLALQNVARFAQWALPFAAHNAKQAVLTFDGDVYQGLAAMTLSAADLDFAQSHLRLLSGLYGVLRPLDLIQPYRLEMGCRLANARGKDLYAFWGERLVDAVNADLAAVAADALVNLASLEYFKAIRSPRLAAPVIEPVFEDWSARERKFKVVSFHAKRARGLMARFIVSQRLTRADELKGFSAEGYAYVDSASTATHWVFRRESVVASRRSAEAE